MHAIACTVISHRMFGRHSCMRGLCNGDLHFAHRGKFQKLFNDQGEISYLGYSTSFPRNQKQQCRNRVHWGYKHLKYTFDKRKLMEEYWFLAPMSRLSAISSAPLNIFFSETFHYNLSVARAKQLKETTLCKKATE